MLIVPAQLIGQWAGEIGQFSDRIDTWVYHGDKRLQAEYLGTRNIRRQLTRRDRVFTKKLGENGHRLTIILTSYGTL